MNGLIPILKLSDTDDRNRVEELLQKLRLDPKEMALNLGHRAKQTAAVTQILTDVTERGDEALVEIARRFDDPEFVVDQIRITPGDMAAASERISGDLRQALRRSIAQVREYQQHIMPVDPPPLHRPGVELGLRFTPLDRVGLYFPGGKAAYPSSLIMLAVPAQVAGVKQIVVCTPPSKYGQSDVVLAACHELGLTNVYRAGGAAAIAAMAFGTAQIRAVDKIVGPGNAYVQLAKRLLAGAVGLDGFLGPSEILVLADHAGDPQAIASDLLAQAEHDPGSCFLLTDSFTLAQNVETELRRQLETLSRRAPIEQALANESAIIIGESFDDLIGWANRLAVEHVNVQTADDAAVLAKLNHAGAIFVGPNSPVAAGDYVAGPSHCLPTNTTARFGSGISVYEFLKRSSIVRYEPAGIAADADAIIQLATAEHLDAHANSARIRRGR